MNERRAKIHIVHELPKTRRCELLDVARSSAYYQPELVSAQDLALMRLTDEIHLQYPFYGSRRLRNELEDRGHRVNRKRVSAADATDGLDGAVSAAANEPAGQGAQDLPVPPAALEHRAGEPGLGE